VVDAKDLNTLALNWRGGGEDVYWCEADFNGDHVVNAIDLNELALNWRNSAPAATIRTPRAPLPTQVKTPNLAGNDARHPADNRLAGNATGQIEQTSLTQGATQRFLATASSLPDRTEQRQQSLRSWTLRRVDDYFARRTSRSSPRAIQVEYEDLAAHVFASLATDDSQNLRKR
jgi:hypothetical protein